MKNSILILILLSVTAFAQMKGGMDLESESMMKESMQEKLSRSKEISKNAVPSTGVIDQNHYYLGPGDIIFIKINPQMSTGEYVSVSPDGNLVLPRSFGVVDVNDKTIVDVKKQIENTIKVKYDEVIVFLQNPKQCVVEIKGDVIYPDIYTVPGSYKVSDLINLANSDPDQSASGRPANLSSIVTDRVQFLTFPVCS